MKHLEIDNELHDIIKFYCWYNKMSLKEFVNRKLKELPELKAFEKQRKRMRFS